MTTCPSLEELVDREGTGKAHLLACPRCRALIQAYREFQDPAELPEGANPALARSRMTACLAAEMTRGAEPGEKRATRSWFRRPATLALLAAAAVLIVALGGVLYDPHPDSRGPSGILRGNQTPAQTSSTWLEDGSLSLTWPAVDEAGKYRLLFYDRSLEETGSREIGNIQAVTLSPVEWVQLGRPAIWRVEALRSGDRIMLSAPAYVPAR